MSEEKPFKAFDHGVGQVDLTHIESKLMELRPMEIHHKENGTLTGGPTFTLVLGVPNMPQIPKVFGQISVEMLNDALKDIGYEIIKKEN